jgi:hypothetical protein
MLLCALLWSCATYSERAVLVNRATHEASDNIPRLIRQPVDASLVRLLIALAKVRCTSIICWPVLYADLSSQCLSKAKI